MIEAQLVLESLAAKTPCKGIRPNTAEPVRDRAQGDPVFPQNCRDLRPRHFLPGAFGCSSTPKRMDPSPLNNSVQIYIRKRIVPQALFVTASRNRMAGFPTVRGSSLRIRIFIDPPDPQVWFHKTSVSRGPAISSDQVTAAHFMTEQQRRLSFPVRFAIRTHA